MYLTKKLLTFKPLTALNIQTYDYFVQTILSVVFSSFISYAQL